MSDTNTNAPKLSTDIYQISRYVESLKKKYIDIPEDTLYLGVYGYISSVFTNIIENTTLMASEYSQEAIPTKAKFERNVISHALSLGINKVFAIPSEMDVILGFPEEALMANMTNNKFVLDKEFEFNIGTKEQFPYHVDYDIVLRRDKLPNGKYVYNAKYDIDGRNQLSDIINPYLPAIGVMNIEGDSMVTVKTKVRQYKHTQIFKKIIVNNPLENKVLNFEFEDQLAAFYVEVNEAGTSHYLKPVYDGLYDYASGNEFINYIYLDEKNIRLIFNRDSYTPRQNAEVIIHVYTTLGKKCNFELKDYQLLKPLTSDRYSYNGMFVLLQNVSDSQYGADKLSLEDLKNVIPREALSRGSITTYTDLNNAFNSIQADNCKMYFLEKVHNQIERLYYAYLLMKEEDNVIPTNTITARVTRGMFDGVNKDSFTIKPGSAYYIDPDTDEINGVVSPSEQQIKELDEKSFFYMNPYLTVVNKSPFYVSYYMTLMNYTRELFFEYINNDSILQFISVNFYMHRDFYTDPDTYKIELKAVQNINTDFQLITYNGSGALEECKLKIIAVIYSANANGEEIPVRYIDGELDDFAEDKFEYKMVFKFTTNDQISARGTFLTITSGMKAIKSGREMEYNIAPSVKMKLFYLVKMDTRPAKGRVYGTNETLNLDDIVPDLEDYTLTNVYNAGTSGLDIFYDYSDIQNSFINLERIPTGFDFTIHKIPVVRYTYMNRESRFRYLFKQIDKRRRYIESILLLLEDSFGIDYKFFNTYGKSLMYNIENTVNIDRINLKLDFEIKFQVASEHVYIPAITKSIKEYIEDMNNLVDLHIPNLITYITNLYREQIVYIKFIGLNEYQSLYQSIYKNPEIDENYFVETQTVPEFINVNTRPNDTPEINFKIV
jgi:hypothetical protein